MLCPMVLTTADASAFAAATGVEGRDPAADRFVAIDVPAAVEASVLKAS